MNKVCLRVIPVLLLLVTVGCQTHSPLSGWGFMSPRDRHSDIGPSIAPAADLPPEVESQQLTTRRGSNLTPKEPAGPAISDDVDATMLVDILDELETLGLDDAERDQFKQDLKDADPAYWSMMIQTQRTTLAFRQQRKNPQDEEDRPDVLELVDTEQPGPRVGSPGNWERKQLDGMAQQAMQATQLVNRADPTRRFSGSTQPPMRLPQTETGAGINPVTAATGNDPFFDDGRRLESRDRGPTSESPIQRVAYQNSQVDPVRPARTPGNPLSNVDASADWEATLNTTIGALEREIAQARTSGDTKTAAQQEIRLRMLYMLAHRNEDALRAVPGLDATQQDYWSQQLYALATYLDEQREPDAQRRAAAANEFLAEATERLGELSELKVKGLAFCTEVISYGVYKKFEEYKFRPGEQLLLYAEVENFFSEATPKGHHTALLSSYELLDSRGQIVEEHAFDLTEEYCQNARRDFFIRYFLYMPQRIYDGEYSLRLTIEDTLGHKVGQASIDFSVAGR